MKEYEGLAQVLLRANSDKKYGLNGFLNEILDNLRHLVLSASAREIGVIKKEQVINIIDSVVQRSSFTVSDGDPSVNVRDSFVQRAEIKADEERKKREEERLRKEREERRRMEDEAQSQIQEKERQRKAQEIEEQGRKAREERDWQRRLDAQRKEKELQEHRAEEERQRRRNEEAARIQSEKEEERLRLENEKKSSSGGKWFFAVIIILGLLAFGWYVNADSSSPDISTPQKTTPSATTAPVMTAKATPSASSLVTSSADQKTIINSIRMEFVSIPAGEFDMGSPSNEKDRDSDEGPVHRVKISNAFYMGK